MKTSTMHLKMMRMASMSMFSVIKNLYHMHRRRRTTKCQRHLLSQCEGILTERPSPNQCTHHIKNSCQFFPMKFRIGRWKSPALELLLSHLQKPLVSKCVLSMFLSMQNQTFVQICVYCMDVGPHIWTCIGSDDPCDLTICVATAEGEPGCVDATRNFMTGKALVTKDTFVCPSCYRRKNTAIPVRTMRLHISRH